MRVSRITFKPLVAALFCAACGCAPWASQPSLDYVTVEGESGQDTAEARKLYDKARKQMAAHACGDECDLAKIEKLLQQSLAADVRFGPAHHSLGVLYYWQYKLYLAAWEFEYAARLMPDRFEPLNNLGLVYESAGKFSQARMYYELAREKAQANPDVIGNLARVCFRCGETVAEMRPILEDVVATDTRPEWRRWAAEQLGLHSTELLLEEAAEMTTDHYSIPSSAVEPSPTVEELPLIVPPTPDSPSLTPAADQSTTLTPSSGSTLELGVAARLDEAGTR
jgi:Tfp pilus assembly protein PilF